MTYLYDIQMQLVPNSWKYGCEVTAKTPGQAAVKFGEAIRKLPWRNQKFPLKLRLTWVARAGERMRQELMIDKYMVNRICVPERWPIERVYAPGSPPTESLTGR